MSVTEYIMAMSLTPTKGPTSPDASVETISLGRPIGRARMPAVIDGGAAAAADAEHAADILARGDEAGESLTHRRDSGAAVVGGKHRVGTLRMEGRDFPRRNIHIAERRARSDIDEEGIAAGGLDLGADEGEFLALGVCRPTT